MKVTSGIWLLPIFCLSIIAVLPAYATVPSTNPNLAARLVNPNPAPGSGILYGENGIPPDPYRLVFDEYHIYNGTQFTANAVIQNLDIGWALTNANFTLSYNATLTDLVSAVLDSGWAGPGNVVDTTTPGTIDVVAYNPANPSGNILVLNMTFQIKGQGVQPPRPLGSYDESILVFSNMSLSGSTGSIPTDPQRSGVVTVKTVHIHPAYAFIVTRFTSSKNVVGQGFSTVINVTGVNYGWQNATFKITVYANATQIGSKNITLLGWGMNSTTASITWNTTGFNKGNYTISASVTPPEGQPSNFTDGWVTVIMIGDVTGSTIGVPDGRVDIKDLAVIAKCFGANYPDPRYNANYDLNDDGRIDIKDLSVAAKNYGKTDP